ncbi:WSC-domain-containing protein [Xylona heveae TC161]|uniref:WSC-domain-containing protein n=1 Tax=Xylona heveae (strain CBS 132557 / TC161) TaxID=1328760 RepID=A0A165ABE4_XYLHT|nr:WSC-domain-containing protein [Xylona heveae TC161]KZF20208.1 WSC-domain-containing protein [Xylona heveae TC161]
MKLSRTFQGLLLLCVALGTASALDIHGRHGHHLRDPPTVQVHVSKKVVEYPVYISAVIDDPTIINIWNGPVFSITEPTTLVTSVWATSTLTETSTVFNTEIVATRETKTVIETVTETEPRSYITPTASGSTSSGAIIFESSPATANPTSTHKSHFLAIEPALTPRQARRRATQIRTYLRSDGSTTEDPSKASIFDIINGQLVSDGHFISTNATSYSLFAVGLGAPYSTTFSRSGSAILWSNNAFPNKYASFYISPSGDIFASFRGSVPKDFVAGSLVHIVRSSTSSTSSSTTTKQSPITSSKTSTTTTTATTASSSSSIAAASQSSSLTTTGGASSSTSNAASSSTQTSSTGQFSSSLINTISPSSAPSSSNAVSSASSSLSSRVTPSIISSIVAASSSTTSSSFSSSASSNAPASSISSSLVNSSSRPNVASSVSSSTGLASTSPFSSSATGTVSVSSNSGATISSSSTTSSGISSLVLSSSSGGAVSSATSSVSSGISSSPSITSTASQSSSTSSLRAISSVTSSLGSSFPSSLTSSLSSILSEVSVSSLSSGAASSLSSVESSLTASSTTSTTPTTTATSTTTTTQGSAPTSTPASPDDVAGWVSLGCYTEATNGRALAGASTAGDSNNLQTCSTFCSSFDYFGVEYGRECYCGNSLSAGSVPATDNGCNMACNGNSAETCGGGSRLNLYERDTAVTTTSAAATATPVTVLEVADFGYLGCYTEGTNSRALTGESSSGDANTVQSCATTCSGFTYFGVEYSRECYCGNVLSAGAVVASDGGCTMTCAGNSSEYCGGPSRLNIYELNSQATASAAPATQTVLAAGDFVSIGCYTEATNGRALTDKSTSSNSNTVASCANTCSSYNYFGVEYGAECYCGNTISAGSVYTTDGGCNMDCSGDETEFCGGPSHLNMYQKNSTTPGYVFMGCYTEGTNARALPDKSTAGSSNTVESCYTFCSGYSYFGVEYSDECYCGNTLSTGSVPATDNGCTMPCAGNSTEMCGGPNRLDLYMTD